MMGWTLFWIVVALTVGWNLGWVQAHREVARECERLGSFYVGEQVYRCTAVEKRHD